LPEVPPLPIRADCVSLHPGGMELALGDLWNLSLVDVTTGADRPPIFQGVGAASLFGFDWNRKRSPISALEYSSDGNTLCAGHRDGTVTLAEGRSGKILFRFRAHDGAVLRLSIRVDGALLATASRDVVKVWEVSSRKELISLPGRVCASFSPDGKLLAGATADNLLRIWNTETWQEVYSLRGHSAPVNCLAISPDGRYAVSADCARYNSEFRRVDPGSRSEMYLWDMKSGEQVGVPHEKWTRG
jgi:WD40 repeat protein